MGARALLASAALTNMATFLLCSASPLASSATSARSISASSRNNHMNVTPTILSVTQLVIVPPKMQRPNPDLQK